MTQFHKRYLQRGRPMPAVTESQRIAARIVGFTLVFGMLLVMFGQFYLSANIIVPRDATQTAMNMLAHESRFRFYAVCNLLYVMDLVVLTAALYVMLRPVGQGLALAALL